MSKRRVVITGLGVVSSIGTGIDKFWSGIEESRNGVDLVESFDVSDLAVKMAGEVRDFDAVEFLGRKPARQLDRCVHFALKASQEAMDDYGLELDQEDRERIGVSRTTVTTPGNEPCGGGVQSAAR